MMSYIEKKYYNKINDTFTELNKEEQSLIELLEYKSPTKAENIAKICSEVNKKINVILKKYYPEIKELESKLHIKANLKFYFDLIDKLTDFIRNVENFNQLDEKYYRSMIKFISEKDDLISNKYKNIATQELTSFYDQQSRNNLEKILEYKLNLMNREYFSFGPLEEEIRKIVKISSSESIKIKIEMASESDKKKLQSANSRISFSSEHELSFELNEKVLLEIKTFLESKSFEVIEESNSLITDAKLFGN
ncbi:MAG: hypothetical protein GF317_23915 [Candidatus Lokiarchaeota archaeon]|nr:hypothetical protein [Candidatus Lokiarchaeota archaeon]MBD3202420.1 hypothetical protein [Candidatus Lokiarchaeota archaeon]